ncbi:molybdopterin molybdotransferase MoeA [Kocuria sp. cx-455]|uniref:molybdopterin molybdotransferase MoeA n=1 Tax=Kocuria sp. cx-455 TaxID=2771377 RepID=UPI001682BFA0|nr:molybdopterin molybdotransferase MoeA [Kocuria sp. cx-455]MBD2764295.1 molybdopterin molybdotransferase MoeA [Kocuria sp. cx-455]
MAEPAPVPHAWWRGITPAAHARRAQAQQLAHELGRAVAATLPPSTSVGLPAAVGATLAQDVRALCPVPHYTSSAMDGYAVCGSGPWRLVDGDPTVHDAASTAAVRLTPGQAVPVVTGGVIPAAAETIIRDEYAVRSGNALRFDESGPRSELAGRHIRQAGAECSAGDVILTAGTVVTPADVAFAAVSGVDTLPVAPVPAARLLLTGSEVQVSGVPAPGFVRDAFSPSLPAVLETLGARVAAVERIPDDAAAFASALEDAVAHHLPLVITTGGTAHSRTDHVRAHLERHATAIIDELDLQPGHPTVFAACSPGTAVLALPGNPLAAMTALTLLAIPFLHGVLGRPVPANPRVCVAHDIPGAPRERLLPAVQGADGAWSLCRDTGANMLSGLSRADALLSVPVEGLSAGARTTALVLPW